MARVLLKRVRKRPASQFQEDIAKISRLAVSIKSACLPCLEMYSRKEIETSKKSIIEKNR